MGRLCLLLAALALAMALGCDGDDGNGNGENGDSGNGDGAGTRVLAQGTAAPIPGRYWGETYTAHARVSVSEPGTLVATVTDGDAALIAAFRHPATEAFPHRQVEGPSPLVLTVAVTADLVAAGHEWLFYAATRAVPPHDVSYVITFTPR